MAEATFTYKDNPYPEGTKEHQVWYEAFVHGLNSASRENRLALNLAICLADKDLSGKVSTLLSQAVRERVKAIEKQVATKEAGGE